MQMSRKLLANPLKTKIKNNLKETDMIVIRHGESIFNFELAKVRALKNVISTEKWQRMRREVKFNDSYIDCGLTYKGAEQAQKAGEALSEHNISTFIVSPLRRNILT